MTAPTVDDLLRAAGLDTLGSDPPAEAVQVAVRRLAMSVDGSDPIRRVAIRDGAIRRLRAAGVASPARYMDAALAETAGDEDAPTGQGRTMALRDPEPWPDAVDGAALLDAIAGTVRRYLATRDSVPDAVALWTMHAHAHDAADVSPILALTSPEKRCGKTTMLHVLGALVPRPLPAANITAAALFRVVEAVAPTLLVDEADSFLRDREELRGVLNSGHARASAYVVRTVGDDHEPRIFGTWAAKAIAIIGDLPATLEDRSIIIPMRRRAPDEQVERLRLDRLRELEPLRRRAWRWALDHVDVLRDADPATPSQLHDRAADSWRPLLAIADAVGGEWPARARRAALALSGAADDGDAPGIMLLADLRSLFAERGVDELPSRDIVAALVEMEDRPWPEWRRGQPISTRSLARLLMPFGIGPVRMRTPDGSQVRGYGRDAFRDAWRRYLPLPRQEGGPDPSQCHTSRQDAENPESASVTDTPDVTGRESPENGATTRNVTGVTGVTGGSGGEGVPTPDLWGEVDG